MSGMAISGGPAAPEDVWHKRGQDWALCEALDSQGGDVWIVEDAARAYSAGARLAEKMANERITALTAERDRLAAEVEALRTALPNPPALTKSMQRECTDPWCCAYHRSCMGKCKQPLVDMNTAVRLRKTDAAMKGKP